MRYALIFASLTLASMWTANAAAAGAPAGIQEVTKEIGLVSDPRTFKQACVAEEFTSIVISGDKRYTIDKTGAENLTESITKVLKSASFKAPDFSFAERVGNTMSVGYTMAYEIEVQGPQGLEKSTGVSKAVEVWDLRKQGWCLVFSSSTESPK